MMSSEFLLRLLFIYFFYVFCCKILLGSGGEAFFFLPYHYYSEINLLRIKPKMPAEGQSIPTGFRRGGILVYFFGLMQSF